jgi:hypothetical protein
MAMKSSNKHPSIEVICAALLLCFPLVVALCFIHSFAVDVFNADEFVLAQRFDKFAQGDLNYGLFMQPHNEHPAAIAILLMILIGTFTSYSSIAFMYTSWFLLAVSLAIIILALAKARLSNLSIMLSATIAAACLFSLRDSEVFLLGIEITATLTFAFATASFYFLSHLRDENDRKRLALAVATAFASTFGGFASGFFCWPIGLLLISTKALQQRTSVSFKTDLLKWRIPLIVWTLASTVASLLFFLAPGANKQYAKTLDASTAGNLPLTELSAEWVHRADFLVTLLGSAIHGYGTQILGGLHLLLILLGSMLFIANVKRWRTSGDTAGGSNTDKRNLLLFGSAFLFLAFLASLAITLSRCENYDLTCIIATAPRYILWTNISFLGAYLIAIADATSMKPLRVCVFSLAIALATTGYVSGIANSRALGELTKNQFIRTKYFLLSYKQQHNDELLHIFPDLQGFFPTAEAIEKRKWNVFAKTPPDLNSLPPCETQSFQITVVTPVRHEGTTYYVDRAICPKFVIGGWSVDVGSARPSGDIWCNLGDKYALKGLCGEVTEVLAVGLGRNKLLRSGFVITFDTNKLEPGRYPVSLTIANNKRDKAMKTKTLMHLEIR